jgi:hypothetical protein
MSIDDDPVHKVKTSPAGCAAEAAKPERFTTRWEIGQSFETQDHDSEAEPGKLSDQLSSIYGIVSPFTSLHAFLIHRICQISFLLLSLTTLENSLLQLPAWGRFTCFERTQSMMIDRVM